MPTLNKERIKQRFKKSLNTYNQCAQVQKQMADFLMHTIKKNSNSHFPHILEIGCGTGLLTRQISEQFTYKKLYVNDLVEEVESLIKQNIPGDIQFFAGDAERIANFPAHLDLIISNAAFQWISSPELLLTKFYSLLNFRGIIAFSAFGPDHFKEIKKLLGPGLQYLNLKQLEQIVKTRFEILCFHDYISPLYFKDGRSVLKHLKTTGVNSLYQPAWSKTALASFAREYDRQFKCGQGVALTFHPFICMLRKKA